MGLASNYSVQQQELVTHTNHFNNSNFDRPKPTRRLSGSTWFDRPADNNVTYNIFHK